MGKGIGKPYRIFARKAQFSDVSRSRSMSASSGVSHRSNVTPHAQATVSRYHSGSVGWRRRSAGRAGDDRGRVFEVSEEVHWVHEMRSLSTTAKALHPITGTLFVSDYIFHRKGGQPIEDVLGPCERPCATAGVPGLLFHDLRRSRPQHGPARCVVACGDEDQRSQDRIDLPAVRRRERVGSARCRREDAAVHRHATHGADLVGQDASAAVSTTC
jgi:hypothetical protein